MLRTGSITAGVACLLLAACQPPNKPQPLTAADSTALTKIVTDYTAAWNKGSVDGVVALYASDGVRQLQDTVALKGANAIRTNLNSALGTPMRTTVRTSGPRVRSAGRPSGEGSVAAPGARPPRGRVVAGPGLALSRAVSGRAQANPPEAGG